MSVLAAGLLLPMAMGRIHLGLVGLVGPWGCLETQLVSPGQWCLGASSDLQSKLHPADIGGI